MISYNTNSEAYIGTIIEILERPDFRSNPRGFPVLEKMDYSFRVLQPNSSPIVTKDTDRNEIIRSYTQKEMELYNSGTNSVEVFCEASKFWAKLANPDSTVNSAYGHLIWKKESCGSRFEMYKETVIGQFEDGESGLFVVDSAKMRTPWDWAKQCLLSDKDTRQTILRFSLPEHQWVGNKDQVCTLHGNFLIRDDKLHLSMVMRSNDMMLGLVYDLPWFCSLMDKMIEELKLTYPNLTKGFYTHTVHSIHIYERDLEKVRKMIGYDK